MPSLPHNSWAIDFLSHLVSNGTTAISTGAVPRLDNVIGSPSIQSIPTTPVLSVNTKFQNITTPLDNVSQETMAWFASYVMMQGIFFGAAAILLYQALTTALRKRNAITALNALQIGLWIGRTLILIIFSIAPGFLLDCYWLQYGAGAASSGVAICIWWLQFAKFKAIYANKTFTSFLVSILCIAGAVLKFSFIWEQVTVDSLDHCFTTSNVDVEDLSAYADVFINALFFILFGTSVVQQVSVNDKAWDRKFRLHFVFTCDVRGSLIVALSHVVKTCISHQSIILKQICDFVQVCAAHCFTRDVVNSSETGIGVIGDNPLERSKKARTSVIQYSCRRKSMGARATEFFKHDFEDADVVVNAGEAGASADTFRYPASLDSLKTMSHVRTRSSRAAEGSLVLESKSLDSLQR